MIGILAILLGIPIFLIFMAILMTNLDIKKHLPKLPPLILAIGAILRIAGTGSAALWFDEATILYRNSLPFLQTWYERTDNSGDLLLELILRPLLALSHSVWILRLPSMLAGLVSLWLVWKLMRRLEFSLPQRIAASTFAALLPGLLWIAQDARSYSLLACLFLVALWFAIEGRWLGLMATCGLMVYAHNTGPVFAISALLVAWYLRPAQLRFILVSGAIAALAWIPAAIHMSQTWIIQQPWQPTLTPYWFMYSLQLAFWPLLPNGAFYLLAYLLITVTLIWSIFIMVKAITSGHTDGFMLTWMLPPLGLVAASLIARNNFVLYRTLTPILFPFAIWVGYELGRRNFPWHPVLKWWIPMLLIGLMLWHPADRGGRLDRVAGQIRSQWRTGDALIYTSFTVGLPFDYYLGDLPHSWDDTLKSPFLDPDEIVHTDQVKYAASRLWVIIPHDDLVTPAERARLDDLVRHQAPLWTIIYVQAAPINIYLVEVQDEDYQKGFDRADPGLDDLHALRPLEYHADPVGAGADILYPVPVLAG